MPGATFYAVYHRACGHIIGAPNERWMADEFVQVMAAKGQYQWRIRTDVTDDDLMALLRGDRCALCRQDDPEEIK